MKRKKHESEFSFSFKIHQKINCQDPKGNQLMQRQTFLLLHEGGITLDYVLTPNALNATDYRHSLS